MNTNSQIIRKADLALVTLTAGGGALNQDQVNTFIRTLIDQPTLIRQSRIVAMGTESLKIPKIKFGSRILRPGVENTALAVGDRSTPDFDQIVLTSKEVIAEIRLPYATIEDNIERGNVNFGNTDASGGMVDTIIALIAERAALDLEELALLGDTSSTDTYLALLDGWLTSATDHVVDNAGGGTNLAMFTAGLKALPNPYKRNLGALRHFLSHNNNIDYSATLAGRETAMGDTKHQTPAPNYGQGVMIDPVALMPEERGLLTFPKNLIFGIHRDISFEAEKLISERQYKIVVTARVAAEIEETDAVVTYSEINVNVP